ncbi:MAG TPA: nucleotidyltransferase family protein [Vicinamibacteria bacterium]|nr:nucleotidyltransferase family protein [Vicinamibacteria bacterium]
MSSPSPREHELLLRLARLALAPPSRDRVRALIREGVDWDSLSALAKRHRVTPLVQRHLAREAADLCPAPVLESMASTARAIATLNMMLTAELAELLPDLEKAGCRPVVIKGPALAVAVYGDLASRPFGDVDIVVEPWTRSRACDLLEHRGYVPSPSVPRQWQEAWRRSTHAQLFEREGSPLVVDLHWELAARGYSYSMRLRDVRSRLERVQTGAAEVWTLGPEDTVLVLCIHGAKHDWAVLSWLVDLAELVRSQPGLDWDAVLLWSRVPGRGRPVQLGLHLAHRVLEAPVPAEVLAQGALDPDVAALVAVVEEAFRDSSSASRRGPWAQLVGSVWFRATESGSDRLRHLHEWLLMPRPPDYEWVSLPTWAWPAYYLVRPLRLLLKHSPARLGRWRGRSTGPSSAR